MVRMARQMDLRKMTTETINEQLDIEALPMAPKVPAEPSGVQTGPPHPKQKVTMVKRLSQKLIRKKKKRNGNTGLYYCGSGQLLYMPPPFEEWWEGHIVLPLSIRLQDGVNNLRLFFRR